MPSSATSLIYTLSLHDALPISLFLPSSESGGGVYEVSRVARIGNPSSCGVGFGISRAGRATGTGASSTGASAPCASSESSSPVNRSEEHTSELQSPDHLVCRLLRPPLSTHFPYTTLFRSLCFYRVAKVAAVYTKYRGWRGLEILLPVVSVLAFHVQVARQEQAPLRQVLRRHALLQSLLRRLIDRKSTRLNSSHQIISYAVFCDLPYLHTFPTRRSSDLFVFTE